MTCPSLVRSVRVILAPFSRITENGERCAHFLKRFGSSFRLILVWMELQGQLSVGLPLCPHLTPSSPVPAFGNDLYISGSSKPRLPVPHSFRIGVWRQNRTRIGQCLSMFWSTKIRQPTKEKNNARIKGTNSLLQSVLQGFRSQSLLAHQLFLSKNFFQTFPISLFSIISFQD